MNVYVRFSLIFLLGILIFEGLTAQRLYKSFGVEGLKRVVAKEPNLCEMLSILISLTVCVCRSVELLAVASLDI
jgi:hypothetical protein